MGECLWTVAWGSFAAVCCRGVTLRLLFWVGTEVGHLWVGVHRLRFVAVVVRELKKPVSNNWHGKF